MIEAGTRWAFIFYGATSLLALFIVPNKLGIIPYILFLGLYGIVKYYIEGIKNMAVEIILKGAFFMLCVLGSTLIVKELFMGDVYSKFPLWALAMAGLLIFYIYDYAYTRFVIYYETVLRKKI